MSKCLSAFGQGALSIEIFRCFFQYTNKKGRTLRNSGDQGLTQLFVVVARTLMDSATVFIFLLCGLCSRKILES